MSEGTVIFTYNGKQTLIQCYTNEKFSKICESFINKIQLDKSKIYYYLYNGNILNKELSFESQINLEDKKENKMNIIVIDEFKYDKKNNNIIESEEIICPECKENILISIKDYRISMHNCNNCKNNHKFENTFNFFPKMENTANFFPILGNTANLPPKRENLSIKEFNNTQKIDISKIICDICKINNKSNVYNNEIFKCITCGHIICPLCRSKHDNKHIIVKYEERNIKCKKHNEKYVKYCKKCNENICMECIEEHNEHEGINYTDLIIKSNNTELKEHIDKLIENIDEIIYKLEDVKENMKIYYNKSNIIINNKRKRNYEMLENIKEFNNNNNIIIKDIKEIINAKTITNKFKNIMDIYERMCDLKLNVIFQVRDLNICMPCYSNSTFCEISTKFRNKAGLITNDLRYIINSMQIMEDNQKTLADLKIYNGCRVCVIVEDVIGG